MKPFNNLENKCKDFTKTLDKEFSNISYVDLKELDNKKTVLVIMDMINGFAKKGSLMDKRITELIPGIVKLQKEMIKEGFEVLAFADYHDENSPEFNSFPIHCLADSEESEVIDEIKEIGGYNLIHKNSTNGFFAPKFQEWFSKNQDKDTYVLVGDCTDICIMEFGLTIKAYFDQMNKNVNVIVPKDLVDTYDLGAHDGDIINLAAMHIMQNAGIKIVSNIK